MSFESKLQEILADDDFDVYDRDGFSDMVDDLRDIDVLHANLIMMAFDAEIFEEISDEIEIDQDFYDDHVEKLKDEYGLTQESADWTVKTCCTIYGEKVLMMDCDFRGKSVDNTKKASVLLNACRAAQRKQLSVLRKWRSITWKRIINTILLS